MIKIDKLFIKHFIKFGIVGAFNFILTAIIFYLLLKVIRINYVIALSMTWIVGICITYIINFMWVFLPEEKLDFQQRFFKYLIVYAVSFFINLALLTLIKNISSFDLYWSQFLLIPTIVIINFLGIRYWALSSRPR